MFVCRGRAEVARQFVLLKRTKGKRDQTADRCNLTKLKPSVPTRVEFRRPCSLVSARRFIGSNTAWGVAFSPPCVIPPQQVDGERYIGRENSYTPPSTTEQGLTLVLAARARPRVGGSCARSCGRARGGKLVLTTVNVG